ncbi:hypothetical protein L227DRAFT_573341 [Lentinus tigrinus ALCF2SS1-6]|uniref:F-box domain-containing protein n=1 Tax=Lentinus tigrinus ALCF2SS1-6 TaxID=1328759 RepID=A0A5C2SHS4_9APHY|nr:hypothetical protein L227DRAFT_573341 [Lentinus tigrinus ALCF2SS1-6]
MSLLDLSQEILVHILSYLHYNDLNVCRRLNKPFNRLIQGSTLLQYSMRLQLAGYEDNPYSPLVLADKLRLLKQQEAAWLRLDFDKPATVRIPFVPTSIYDLTDGILLLGESTAGGQSMAPGGQTGADSIRWTRLSSLYAPGSSTTPQDSWEQIEVGAHIMDVGLAVQEHDLIVVATDRETEDSHTVFELRLIQLSTGLSHPLASKPILPLGTLPAPPHDVTGQCSVCIEIVGDQLCFMFHYPPGSVAPPAMFQVYDWKSGRCLQVRGLDCPNYSTFTFLAPNIIALPNCADNTIELCHIGNVSEHAEHTEEPQQLETSCVLQLPRLGKGHSITQVTCRSEPKLTSSSKTARSFRPTEPFYLNPENAIAIFNVMTHDSHGFHECLTLIVHTASLLSTLTAPDPSTVPADHVSAPAPAPRPPPPTTLEEAITWYLNDAMFYTDGELESQEPSPPPPPEPPGRLGSARCLSWSQWGPRACRWLETSFSASRWITTTCGQRYVTVEEDTMDDGTTRSTIVVFDFNPHTVRRLAALHRKRRRRMRGFYDLGEGHTAIPAAYARLEDSVLIPFTDERTRVIGQIQCDTTELMAGYAMEYRIFEEPVRTSLPYAQMSSYDTFAYGAVLLDRNMVIGVKLSDTDDIRELVIHAIRMDCPV